MKTFSLMSFLFFQLFHFSCFFSFSHSSFSLPFSSFGSDFLISLLIPFSRLTITEENGNEKNQKIQKESDLNKKINENNSQKIKNEAINGISIYSRLLLSTISDYHFNSLKLEKYFSTFLKIPISLASIIINYIEDTFSISERDLSDQNLFSNDNLKLWIVKSCDNEQYSLIRSLKIWFLQNVTFSPNHTIKLLKKFLKRIKNLMKEMNFNGQCPLQYLRLSDFTTRGFWFNSDSFFNLFYDYHDKFKEIQKIIMTIKNDSICMMILSKFLKEMNVDEIGGVFSMMACERFNPLFLDITKACLNGNVDEFSILRSRLDFIWTCQEFQDKWTEAIRRKMFFTTIPFINWSVKAQIAYIHQRFQSLFIDKIDLAEYIYVYCLLSNHFHNFPFNLPPSSIVIQYRERVMETCGMYRQILPFLPSLPLSIINRSNNESENGIAIGKNDNIHFSNRNNPFLEKILIVISLLERDCFFTSPISLSFPHL